MSRRWSCETCELERQCHASVMQGGPFALQICERTAWQRRVAMDMTPGRYSCYRAVASMVGRPVTIDDIAAAVGHGRNWARQTVVDLIEAGWIAREEVRIEAVRRSGGRSKFFVYQVLRDPDAEAVQVCNR